MRLSASDVRRYYRPSPCEGRLYLAAQGIPEGPPSPYEQMLRTLGQRHEQAFIATLDVEDVSAGDWESRERRTREAVAARTRALYQPVLRTRAILGGEEHEIVGVPDVLGFEAGRFVITDCRVARRITEKDHPEILRTMELYGWLCERALGESPVRLQVYGGAGQLLEVPGADSANVEGMLRRIASARMASVRPYEPVGWSRCGACCYGSVCLKEAEQAEDVALIPDVDGSLARVLHEIGVRTWDELLLAFDDAALADLERPWGKKSQRVGVKAALILKQAEALATRSPIWLREPALPEGPYVLFDLEGLPPLLDEREVVYLWGLQVVGGRVGGYCAALAEFGADGDRLGWERFLLAAERLFAEHGDLPFVHWSAYERSKVAGYVRRYGDANGVAERVQRNLLNLLPIVEKSVVLPVPSYSLKVVERYVGFERAGDHSGGDWSIAKYMQAAETDDAQVRAAIMQQVLDYNREDLEATWAVLKWFLRGGCQEPAVD